MATPQPTSTTEHIPAAEHGRGFPPFDSQSFASQILWLALTFIALYLLMSRLALPRVQGILDARSRRIDEDVGQAQALKEQSDAALAAHEQALNEARARAQALANERRERAVAAAEARRREVEAKLNAHIGEAETSIAEKRTAAMVNVRGIAAEAATAIVERLTGKAPTSEQVSEAVSTVFKT
jgi:F-type H+-transporting ATPase subunit b